MSPTHHQLRKNSGQVAEQEQTNLSGPWKCCSPNGCIYNDGSNAEHILITKDDLRAGQEAVIKLICSNDGCNQSPYMHTACFQAFEESALTYLKSHARAKSWSDRQKLQNLWTKKGYDLAFKACECCCGHGHLRKDLDWMPETAPPIMFPPSTAAASIVEQTSAATASNNDPDSGKRKRKKSKTQSGGSGGKATTICTIGLPTFSQGNVRRSDAQNVPSSRNRTNSVSSITSGSSFGSSSGDVSCGHSHSSNEGIHPPRRAALLQDRSR